MPLRSLARSVTRCLHCAFALAVASSVGLADVILAFDADAGPIEFGAAELSAVLASETTVVARPLAAATSHDANATDTLVVLARVDSPAVTDAIAAQRFAPPAVLRAEGFSIRIAPIANATSRSIWILGADAAGVMYGALEVAEIARAQGLAAIADLDRNPHFAERGVKFNIPLDARTPSYTDAGEPAQQNIATVWDMTFWRDYIDRLARDRYNLVSLWNLHPFPSLVRVPEYPDVALDDVQRSTTDWKEFYSTWAVGLDAPEILDRVETLAHLTIDEKIEFWREVMRYGRSRNVKFYVITWNVFVNGTAGRYGITDALDNATTADYVRRSVRELVLTYPELAGIGLTTGENMLDATAAEKEDWAFRTFGQGVLDALAVQPQRKLAFIHRQHEAGAKEIAKQFAPLVEHPNVDFIYSFKYAEAHALSSTKQNFHANFLQDVGDHPVLWTLRNDDAYFFRWGAPDFVREFIRHMPAHPTRGFYYGSDQWVWARDFLDLERAPDAARQLEHEKHSYHWLLWGRLGYDPDLSNDRLQSLLAERFNLSADAAAQLFAAWQDASMIYPLTTGFHWGRFDFQWYIEASKSRPDPARTPTGFHDLNRFITLPPHPESSNVSIPDYVAAVQRGVAPAGTTPLQVAEQLHRHADHALAVVDTVVSGGRRDRDPDSAAELRRTLEDIRAMAHLGKYYAHKIRAATELALLRATLDRTHHTILAEELNQSAYQWRCYASLALTYYQNPVWLNRVGHVDWRDLYTSVLYDLTTTDSPVAVPSMPPTPGGTILEAEDATTNNVPVRDTTPGFTGAGYRDMAGSQGRRWIEWTFDAPIAGRYILEFRYAMRRQETEPAALTLNGEAAEPLVIWPTGGAQSWAWDRKIVTLRAGPNTIRLAPPLGPNIDHLNILPLEPR